MAAAKSPHIRVVESSAAEVRLAEARAFITRHHGRDIHLVGASRGSVDDLARGFARTRGATVGLHRFSLAHLAVRLAAPSLAADGCAPATALGAEAVAARAAFEAQQDGALRYFAPVAPTPGFPRALARTLHEIRLARVTSEQLAALPLGGPDLAALLERFEEQCRGASTRDRTTLFRAAAVASASGAPASGLDLQAPLLLLDVPLDSRVEFEFVQALMAASREVLITVPFGDLAVLKRLEGLGLVPEVLVQEGEADLIALRRHMFAGSRLRPRQAVGDVRVFSAPGEGRECVEIARRILAEASAGVAFDEMAVFLRAPQRYLGLLEAAFRRVPSPEATDPRGPVGIPAYFDRGTRRPHPAGRAFLAILACAVEKLSARRFAEYLSLAQVPQLDGKAREFSFVVPDDEMLETVRAAADGLTADDDDEAGADGAVDLSPDATGAQPPAAVAENGTDAAEAAVVDGTLRAPWKWETLIVESAVIGGDPQRWHRRLAGLDQEYRVRIDAETKEDFESARVVRLERDRRNLLHLRTFALPIIDELASWPEAATWGDWLDRFAALAPRVLRYPDRVLRVIQELRPMAAIGPVTLDEARGVMSERLLQLEREPPRSRYGRVFVGSPQQARGRTFKVVFVPGLAERMFPQKPHEDPMMLDQELREPLGSDLALQEDRARTERLLLRLAVGSATERLWLSYPRIDVGESRPRVPSFYALDVVRAVTGSIPDHESLQESAAESGGAGLAWPSPADPKVAIDDLEHDLAVLRELLQADSARVRGHANYLLRLNEPLKRAVTARWGRARSQWTPFDGLTRVNSHTQPMLQSQRLAARAYSLSALQKFAACPYQFLLAAIYRLEPAEEPQPLQKLDPLTRGALFHEVQAEFFRALKAQGRLPVTDVDLAEALRTLDTIVTRVAAAYHERLAPAIERVWNDEIADIAKDLRVWARRLPNEQDWVPAYFEFSFGLPRELASEGRDPASLPDPVLVDGRFKLRGSVDLIEVKRAGPGSGAPSPEPEKRLRVTDHKTGKNRTTWRTVIGGGGLLQPVLYSMAVEQALGGSVASGRLFYCTAPGGFTDHEIPLNDANRRAGLEALEIVDRAIELGFLPAAPSRGACTWCDFRAVCGPHEQMRIGIKSPDRLGDVIMLRERP